MVLVNGKKFKTYDLDSVSTFKDRLASKLSTLPEYLYFHRDLSYSDLEKGKKGKITVEDIFTEIRHSAEKNTSIIDLIDSVQSKLGKKFNIRDKVVSLWLAYNKKLAKNYEKNGDYALNSIAKELVKKKIFITESQFLREWKNRKNSRENLENSIKYRNINTERIIELFKEFNEIEDPIVSTEFRIEYIQFILTLGLDNISILELFNSIVLTDTVPFVTTHNFYKVLIDYVPPDEWTTTSNNSTILKVNKKEYITTSSKASNYSDTIIRMDPSSNDVTAEITINTEKDNITRDKFTERSLEVFKGINMVVKKTEESKVVGTFYFPQQTLDKYIFSDLVMNDDIFKLLINIDDHERATKKKPGIYIHFDHPKTGYVTATVTERIMKKSDQSMKGEDQDFFPIGESYIRVRISKSNNIQAVEHFKEMLGKLFIRYDEKYNEIRDFYKKYIPDFGDIEVEEEIEEKNDLKLSEEVPEIFGVGGFSTYCSKERSPTIISEEEAMKLEEGGQSVMKFPRDVPVDPNALKFPADGEDQRYYTCKHQKYKYIGLQENNLKNSDVYPYVPCCFARNQQKKPVYQHYYEGKESKTTDKKQANIISTDKILKHDQYGTLPPNIDNLFTIIDPDPKITYVRRGIGVSEKRNVNSFINAVMEALNDETNILSIEDEDELESELIDQRNKLATNKNAALCRQELYDMSSQDIINIIKNGDMYFDPKWFLHLLEYKFDCNIFLFTKKMLDGEMTLPRHIQAYYKNRNKNRCIYVFEHMGSKSDVDVKYPWPHCELIVKYNNKTGYVQDSFTFKEARNIRNVYSRLRKSYALDTVINETYLPIDSSIKIVSQWIDSYGKTRRLNIRFDGKMISLNISPIQPLRAKETDKEKIHTVDVDIAIKLIKFLRIEIKSQTTIGDTVKEINGILGNVNVSIPVKDTEIIEGIAEKQNSLSYTEDQLSMLEQYNRNKKLARYLVEYTIWIYSKYLYDSDIIDITDDNITYFAKNFFKVDPVFKYGYISKNLSENSPLLENGKLVVHSEETIKRLIYVLRLSIQRNKDNILQYHTKSVIQNYYVDLTDFNQHEHQVILFGEESVEKWISENNIKYVLFDEVQIGINTPYFFKNRLVNDTIYLAQNTTSLNKASNIAVTWERDGYNPGIHAQESDPVSFTLYSYQNSNSIREVKIKGKPFSDEVKILGYKIDNTPFYTTLLPLS